jgi:DNA-binding NarL/FixJ family response regulator
MQDEQISVMAAVLPIQLSTVEQPRIQLDREVTIEDDVKRAWRRGWTIKKIAKKYGGTPAGVKNLVRNTKRKGDINKNNIMIIFDKYAKDKNKRPFYPKKD